MHVTFFVVKVFKTTSNVLNSDVNIVNIALIAFCSLAVTKLAHWAMSSLRRWNARYQNPATVSQTIGRLATGGEIRYKILQRVAQPCFVASLGSMSCVFHLAWSIVAQQKWLLIFPCRLREVVAKSRVRVYFEQPILALFLVFHQTYNWSRKNFLMLRDKLSPTCSRTLPPRTNGREGTSTKSWHESCYVTSK